MTASINEISSLQRKISPRRLEELSKVYPSIAKHMEGNWAGPDELPPNIAIEKARLTIDVLTDAADRCSHALDVARGRISTGRFVALFGQVANIVGGSAVVGCLGLEKAGAAMIAALITLVASIASSVYAFIVSLPGTDEKKSIMNVYQDLYDAQLSIKTNI